LPVRSKEIIGVDRIIIKVIGMNNDGLIDGIKMKVIHSPSNRVIKKCSHNGNHLI